MSKNKYKEKRNLSNNQKKKVDPALYISFWVFQFSRYQCKLVPCVNSTFPSKMTVHPFWDRLRNDYHTHLSRCYVILPNGMNVLFSQWVNYDTWLRPRNKQGIVILSGSPSLIHTQLHLTAYIEKYPCWLPIDLAPR